MKLAVITGADGGMGTEITRAAAKAGYRIVMACYRAEEYTVGQEIKADIFAAGDKIDATATSKGKGYAGA